jgi:hypothetical protein
MSIRSLDDLAGGGGRYRVNWTSSVDDRPSHTRTVLGGASLTREVNAWLAEVLAATGPADRGNDHADDDPDPV